MTMDSMRDNITQMYRNFVEDDTWKHEIAESSQVIALATQVAKLQNNIKDSNGIGAKAITTAEGLRITECMLITKPMGTTNGGKSKIKRML